MGRVAHVKWTSNIANTILHYVTIIISRLRMAITSNAKKTFYQRLKEFYAYIQYNQVFHMQYTLSIRTFMHRHQILFFFRKDILVQFQNVSFFFLFLITILWCRVLLNQFQSISCSPASRQKRSSNLSNKFLLNFDWQQYC